MLRQAAIKNLISFMAHKRVKGHSEEEVNAAVTHAMEIYDAENPHNATSSTPFLDWLKNGGLEQIMQIVMMLLPLFAAPAPS